VSTAEKIAPEEAIKIRAYSIWEEEGRPEGRRLEHWLRAVEELGGTETPEAPAVVSEPAAKRSSKGKSG
jgi:hypothetical protein